MRLEPLSWKEAKPYVETKHRHHTKAPAGWKFGISVRTGQTINGVIMVGRPVSRALDNGFTLEVTRCCTDGTKNVCSMLYSAAARAAKALGYHLIITYVLASESGASVKAAGWKMIAITRGGSWDCPSRPRIDAAPICPKIRFEKNLRN